MDNVNNMNKGFLAAAVSIAIASPPVLAQQLEEVIVTAQKREQSLQDTPIAITAFGKNDIDARGISSVKDLSLFAPNVQIAESPGGSTGATIAIRGSATINPAITWEPTVGIYLDGVFLGKNLGGIFEIAELERVEVLRGPQGTLYGKNTVGGAINMITARPAEEFGGEVSLTAGNEGLVKAKLRIDTGSLGQVGEGMGAFRASLAYLKADRDGFYDNVYSDPTAGANPFISPDPGRSSEFSDLDSQVWRLDTQLDVTDNLRLRYVYDASERDQAPSMGQLTDVNPAVFDGFGVGFLAPLLSLYDTDENERADAISNDQAGREISDIEGHSLFVEWDAGDWGAMGEVSFRSVTSFRDMEWSDTLDIDGSPMNLFTSTRAVDYEQLSQEFQLIGQTDSVNYVVGLYYFEEEGNVFNPISFFGLFGAPFDNNEYGMDNDSIALYGQAEWRPSSLEQLALTVGLRYTDEEKDQYIIHPVASMGGVGAFSETGSDSWDNVSGSLVAAWDFSDQVNAYLKVAQGWKSGGFNGESPTAETFRESYEPEEVLSIELGIKSRLWDDRLQLNAAAFSNDISDMQFSVFLEGTGGAASTVANAGAATIQGLELEAALQITDNVRIGLNYGYLDTEYDEFIELGVDVRDQKDFPYAPESTASISLDWAILQQDWGKVDLHVDWNFKDDYVPYTNPDQNAPSQIDSYDVLNASLIVSEVRLTDDVSMQFGLWGKNITDEEYRQNTIPFGLWTISYYGEPASFGFDARLNF